MTVNQQLDYYEIGDVLARAQVSVDVADCHGLLAGLICAAGFADPRVWVAQVFEGYDPKNLQQAEAQKLLQALYEQTAAAINGAELDFTPLLPDDDDALAERAEALGSWCGGFLSGLGLGGLSAVEDLPADIAELVEDFTQIARVDFELDEADEEELAAFEELVEYVRVGVLFINEELQPSQAPPQMQ